MARARRGWTSLVLLIAPLHCARVNGLVLSDRPSIGGFANFHMSHPGTRCSTCAMLFQTPSKPALLFRGRAVEDLEEFNYVFLSLAGLPPLVCGRLEPAALGYSHTR